MLILLKKKKKSNDEILKEILNTISLLRLPLIKFCLGMPPFHLTANIMNIIRNSCSIIQKRVENKRHNMLQIQQL